MTMVDDIKHWFTAAMASPGFVLSDQVIQIVRMLAFAAMAWVGVEIVSLTRDVAVLRVQTEGVARELVALRALAESSVNDRWKRADHERYADAVDARIRGLERRVDNHARAMTAIVSGKRPQLED